MRYAKSVEELIGKTPLLELSNYEKNHGLKARILAKVEGFESFRKRERQSGALYDKGGGGRGETKGGKRNH